MWRRMAPWMLALIALGAAGCARRQTLKVDYLNGFVPGSHAAFYPAKIALPPITGELASGSHDVGAVYQSDGTRRRILAVSNVGTAIHTALMTALSDAGLTPIALDSTPDPKDLPPGADLMLTCELEEIEVNKRFGPEQTIHGQYFTMNSRVKLKFTLLGRGRGVLYNNEMFGSEDEPPKPVGDEAFFPLETDPAESLSVAVSRAIGNQIIDSKFARVLPVRPR